MHAHLDSHGTHTSRCPSSALVLNSLHYTTMLCGTVQDSGGHIYPELTHIVLIIKLVARLLQNFLQPPVAWSRLMESDPAVYGRCLVHI